MTVAEEDGKILSFAMAASWEFWPEWPFFSYMIEKLPEYVFEGQAPFLCSTHEEGSHDSGRNLSIQS